MSFHRDLAWRQINSFYDSCAASHLARYALSLEYEMLPKEVVEQAKRILLDTLGCAIGAYDSPGRPVCEAAIKEIGGREEATVFGSGLRTSALNATLVNSFMVRYLDMNDAGGGGHNSDSIPSILAVSEREKAGGRDFLTSLVISYELGDRVRKAMPLVQERGFCVDLRGGLSVPPALGKLMGLNEEQIANAIGITACHSIPLGVLDIDEEEVFMRKNLRFGWVAYNALLGSILAQKGFTGPIQVVEGRHGINEVIQGGDMDLNGMLDFSGWRILKVRFKGLSSGGAQIPSLLATLAIVTEQDLKPEDIASVHIRANRYAAEHHGKKCLAKKYPRSGENADHSIYWMSAYLIKNRGSIPMKVAFTEENFTDPVILDLMEKVTVEYDPSLENNVAVSTIKTKDGRQFENRWTKGFGLPAKDKDVQEKFRLLASQYMSEERINKIIDTVWNLENISDMSQLTKLMVFEKA